MRRVAVLLLVISLGVMLGFGAYVALHNVFALIPDIRQIQCLSRDNSSNVHYSCSFRIYK